jgi:hypothetical protein
MGISLRFILPLLLVLGVVAYSVVPLVDSLTLKWFTRDLESRSRAVGQHDGSAASRPGRLAFTREDLRLLS